MDAWSVSILARRLDRAQPEGDHALTSTNNVSILARRLDRAQPLPARGASRDRRVSILARRLDRAQPGYRAGCLSWAAWFQSSPGG